MTPLNKPNESVALKLPSLDSKQIESTIKLLINQNHVLLGNQIKLLSEVDYQLNRTFPWEITEKDVDRINLFINSFGDFIIKTDPMTEESFKKFLVWYMEKHAFDYRAMITWVKLLKWEFEKSFGKNNKTVADLWELIHSSKRILTNTLNEVFKPWKSREWLYSLIWIWWERAGIDSKLGKNEPYQIFMKWMIDEIMSIWPVAEYLVNEPRECVKWFMWILRPLEEFVRTVNDIVWSYTKMFKVDSSTAKWMYEIGKWSTQWFTTLLPTWPLKSLLLKWVVKWAKLAWRWPWLRATTDDF